jgi:hypothetical protein
VEAGAVVGLGLSGSCRGRVAALYAASETAGADRPGFGALDLGEKAAITRRPQSRLARL